MDHHQYTYQPLYQLIPDSNSIQVSWKAVAITVVVLLLSIHRVLAYYDIFFLPLGQLCWNCFVYLMPSSLVLGLGAHTGALDSTPSRTDENSSTHAAKSDVLRTVFNLGSASPSRLLRTNEDSEIPPGLGNWDNSCYQNSVLQALASVRGLQTFFYNVENYADNISDDSTFATLEVLLRNLNNGKNCGKYLWTPAKLKSMSSWQQQDAQEYFSKIMDAVEKDVAAAMRRSLAIRDGGDLSLVTSIINDNKSNRPEDSTKNVITSEENEDNHEGDVEKQARIINPLDGLLAQRVGCTRCGYAEGLSLIPFNCLTLPLGRGYSDHIERCLDESTSLEDIEGVECAKCTLLFTREKLLQQLNDSTLANGVEKIGNHSESLDAIKSYQLSTMRDQLNAVESALSGEDFAESTISKKCGISGKERVSSTKTRQAIILKAPECLVLHVNRSIFDEYTGAQMKNYAELEFAERLDLNPWCIPRVVSGDGSEDETEDWEMNPSRSMLRAQDKRGTPSKFIYELRSIITHQGRHENGHYICYRKVPKKTTIIGAHEEREAEDDNLADSHEQDSEVEDWWRLSDENVYKVDEEDVLGQVGTFMLFYERIPVSEDKKFPSKETGEIHHTNTLSSASEEKAEESDESTVTLTTASQSADEASLPITPDGEAGQMFTHSDGQLKVPSPQANDVEGPGWPDKACRAQEPRLRKDSLPQKMMTSGFHPEDSEERQYSLVSSAHMVAPT